MLNTRAASRGFSLIELVIVVVILGIIGAIAIPRMSRGATGAADSGAVSDLAVLRSAIELYQAEHDGSFPTLADFADQLTKYSNAAGATSDTQTGGYIYGPYLRRVPSQKVGPNKGSATLTATKGEASFGWWYNQTTGAIFINAADTDTDASGTAYNTY